MNILIALLGCFDFDLVCFVIYFLCQKGALKFVKECLCKRCLCKEATARCLVTGQYLIRKKIVDCLRNLLRPRAVFLWVISVCI